MAIFVRKELLNYNPSQADYIYSDPNGKALVVNVKINNFTILLVAVHAPHQNEEQARFLKHLRTKIPAPPASHIPFLFGDFNFTEAPSLDCAPARLSQKSPDAVIELAKLRSHLGGMVDAYRAVHGFACDVTHHGKAGDTKSRHDRGYIGTATVHNTHAPSLRNMHHVSRNDLAVVKQGAKCIRADHDAVVITVRLGNIKMPTLPWKYTRPDDPDEVKEVQTEIGLITAQSKDQDKSPEETIEAIAKAAKGIRSKQIKEKWAAHHKERMKLKRKINSAEQQVPTTQAKRLAKDATINRWLKKYIALETKYNTQQKIQNSKNRLNEDRGSKAHFKPLRPVQGGDAMSHLPKNQL